jgi:hypothetical protein
MIDTTSPSTISNDGGFASGLSLELPPGYGSVTIGKPIPARTPLNNWQLCRKKSGELVLQREWVWYDDDGMHTEWHDVPTVVEE